MVIIIFCQKS